MRYFHEFRLLCMYHFQEPLALRLAVSPWLNIDKKRVASPVWDSL